MSCLLTNKVSMIIVAIVLIISLLPYLIEHIIEVNKMRSEYIEIYRWINRWSNCWNGVWYAAVVETAFRIFSWWEWTTMIDRIKILLYTFCLMIYYLSSPFISKLPYNKNLGITDVIDNGVYNCSLNVVILCTKIKWQYYSDEWYYFPIKDSMKLLFGSELPC